MGAGFYGLLRLEARQARLAIGTISDAVPVADGLYGTYPGEPISFVVLGDSSAAGLRSTPPTRRRAPCSRPVSPRSPNGRFHLRRSPLRRADQRPRRAGTPCRGRSRTSPWSSWVATTSPTASGRRRRSVCSTKPSGGSRRRCRRRGRHLPGPRHGRTGSLARCASSPGRPAGAWPLRRPCGRRGRRRTVSLGSILGPEFATAPRDMFSLDQFHPSSAGYASAAAVVLPSAARALGLWTMARRQPGWRGEDVLPVAVAAVEPLMPPGPRSPRPQVAGHGAGPGDAGPNCGTAAGSRCAGAEREDADRPPQVQAGLRGTVGATCTGR